MQDIAIPRLALPDGFEVPALGQGTWKMGEVSAEATAEAEVLREGIDLGLTLIDTAEMYGHGGAERVVGQAIAGRRDEIFLVSKIMPQNAAKQSVSRHCDASLKRLGVETIDLYLLHWPSPHPLAETVAAFEALRSAGKIKYWGVSNFDTDDMLRLMEVPGGENCCTNQVLYHPGGRGIEYDLLPLLRPRMPVMAYSPLGQGGRLLRAPALQAVAGRHGASPAQIALAWCMRDGNTIAIPKASDIAHLRENIAAAGLRLEPRDLEELDAGFPPPRRKQPLAIL